MWSVVLLFLGLTKAVSYVAGSGTTVDEKSGMLVLHVVKMQLNERATTRSRLRRYY